MAVGGEGGHDDTAEPVLQFAAAFGGFDVLVLLDVVADDEIGAVGADAHAAEPGAGAFGLDGDAGVGGELGLGPGAAAFALGVLRFAHGGSAGGVGLLVCSAGAEIAECCADFVVAFEFGTDVGDELGGEGSFVGDDDDVAAALGAEAPQGVGESGARALGVAARCDAGDEAMVGVFEGAHEFDVERGGLVGEVVGEALAGPDEGSGLAGFCRGGGSVGHVVSMRCVACTHSGTSGDDGARGYLESKVTSTATGGGLEASNVGEWRR